MSTLTIDAANNITTQAGFSVPWLFQDRNRLSGISVTPCACNAHDGGINKRRRL